MLPVNATTGWVAVQTAPESSHRAIPDTPPLNPYYLPVASSLYTDLSPLRPP